MLGVPVTVLCLPSPEKARRGQGLGAAPSSSQMPASLGCCKAFRARKSTRPCVLTVTRALGTRLLPSSLRFWVTCLGTNLLCLPPKMQAGHGVPRLVGELFMVFSLHMVLSLQETTAIRYPNVRLFRHASDGLNFYLLYRHL